MRRKDLILRSCSSFDMSTPLRGTRATLLTPYSIPSSAEPQNAERRSAGATQPARFTTYIDRESLISVRNLSKTYGGGASGIKALRSVSFDVDVGAVLGLLGPNGSGKSTLMGILAGVGIADEGAILWRGQPRTPKAYVAHVGALLEGQGGINERLSTWENARYLCGLREQLFDPKHFAELVELLGVCDVHQPVRQLSTGNRMRSALVATLIHKPALVMLDEPTNGLDVVGEDALGVLVRALSSSGTSFLLSSHDLGFIERMCRQIVCIRHGQVVFEGKTGDFLASDAHYRVEVTFRRDCGPVLPAPWSWSRITDEHGEVLLRDYSDLCLFMECMTPKLPRCTSLLVRHISLRDKYLELVFPERNGSRGGHDAAQAPGQ